jgi:uncharacterized MAPEG superfamily protein
MTSDLHFLVYSTILAWLMLLTASLLRTRYWTMQGMLLAFDNRDNLPEPSAIAGRARRAAWNMLENFVLFTALIVAAHAAGVTGPKVELGAKIFFWARVVYFPLYLAGIMYVRSVAWLAGVIGMGLILAAVL